MTRMMGIMMWILHWKDNGIFWLLLTCSQFWLPHLLELDNNDGHRVSFFEMASFAPGKNFLMAKKLFSIKELFFHVLLMASSHLCDILTGYCSGGGCSLTHLLLKTWFFDLGLACLEHQSPGITPQLSILSPTVIFYHQVRSHIL